ncbi:MAG: hypothetical protein GC183_01555 [Thiobacillus sp.]|nr:hypothetical protein [Thiobacillus sp.]
MGSLTARLSVSALANHNNPWGAAWASMPKDSHNARIEDGPSSAEFSAFVRQAPGAGTVNRYLDSRASTLSCRGRLR